MQSEWPMKHTKGTKVKEYVANQVIGFEPLKGGFLPSPDSV